MHKRTGARELRSKEHVRVGRFYSNELLTRFPSLHAWPVLIYLARFGGSEVANAGERSIQGVFLQMQTRMHTSILLYMGIESSQISFIDQKSKG